MRTLLFRKSHSTLKSQNILLSLFRSSCVNNNPPNLNYYNQVWKWQRILNTFKSVGFKWEPCTYFGGFLCSLAFHFLIYSWTFSRTFCYFDLIMRPGLSMVYILHLDLVCILRYCFVFYTKNPTAIQHEFWMLFLTIWMFSFGMTAQVIFAILPVNITYTYVLGKYHIAKNQRNKSWIWH